MEDKCINYQGHIGNAGYGLDYNPETQKTVLAHRYAYYKEYGAVPKGLVISHSCNNKKCINPNHLSATTQSENVKKAYTDGLQINAHRTLSKEVVMIIFNSNLPQRKLAAMFGTHQKTVGKIKNGTAYRDLTGGGTCGS